MKMYQSLAPTFYSSLFHFVANIDEEHLADVLKSPHLCPDDTLNISDASSPFL